MREPLILCRPLCQRAALLEATVPGVPRDCHARVVVQVHVQCCFTSAVTVRTIKDGEPSTATSTFAQLLSSERLYL